MTIGWTNKAIESLTEGRLRRHTPITVSDEWLNAMAAEEPVGYLHTLEDLYQGMKSMRYAVAGNEEVRILATSLVDDCVRTHVLTISMGGAVLGYSYRDEPLPQPCYGWQDLKKIARRKPRR